jgi:uncharacterized protein YndB with AHSA1/START domain
MTATLDLVVRRLVRASPEKIFAAWTDAASLSQWWGPEGVPCAGAELDVRVGGAYRIGNTMPDGRTVWITGVFERVEPPRELVFTWHVDGGVAERVSVKLTPQGEATDVVVVHQKIVDAAARASHARGWEGCLAGLARHMEQTRPIDR